MPFAIIAVILLISGSAYAVVAAQTEKSSENTEDISEELENIETVIDSTEYFVEKGLGEIIFSLSIASVEGTIEQRAEKYEERAKNWMDFQFPILDNGVTVELQSFSTELSAESLKYSENDLTEGCAPSYLVGEGSFTAKYSSDSGETVKTIDFETDASCALPLVAEQGSLFKNAISGPGSLISQMINYQLTCLAQYRVMNGYGAINEFGDMGTNNILTTKDVTLAYSNSIKILGLTYFRILPERIDGSSTSVDLADYYIVSDGYVEIDLSIVYSQALMSIADDIALQWIDYLYGNSIIDTVDLANDKLKNAWDSLKGFFTNNNEFSAAPYIESVLSENGLDIEKYRYLHSNKTFQIIVPGESISESIGKESSDYIVTLEYPTVDLMSWEGISNFKQHYREDNCEIREWFTNIINSAALKVGSENCFGTIRFKVDSTDGESFLETISKTVESALNNGDAAFEKIISESIGEQNIIDPFYNSIYDTINDNVVNIYGVSTFKENIHDILFTKLTQMIDENYGTVLNTNTLEKIVNSLIDGPEIKNILDTYSNEVDSLMNGFTTLKNVNGEKDNLMKKICRSVLEKGLGFMDKTTNVPERIVSLCREMRENIAINSYCDPIQLPGTDSFVITDNAGNSSIEKMSMDLTSNPAVEVYGPNSNLSDCIHYVGFLQNSGASYSTVFSVSIKDDISYKVSSKGSLENYMGISDSEIKDSCQIDLLLKITVVSAWALQGVNNYCASNTVLSDAWNSLVNLLSPLLEPLKKILSMIMDALTILNSALIEISKFVTDIVQKLYNALMEPLEELKEMIENKIEAWFTEAAENLVGSLEWILNVNASKQTAGFSYMGFTLTITLNLASLIKNTKTLLTIKLSTTVSDLDVSGSITIKQKGEDSSKELIITGSASIVGDDWDVKADIDPTMKTTKYLICVSGNVKGTDFDIVMPEVISYNEIDFSLQDIPGLGTILSNIPMGAAKVSIDLGLNLKYNAPFKNGLVVNEFESNPEGTDTNCEWVELYNASSETIDISGYSLRAGTNKTKTYTISSTELQPGGRLIIDLPGSFLNNSGSSNLKGGEYVMLMDCDGNTVDKTPTKKDTANDNYTWQRVADASTEWIFEEGTRDTKNCGGILTGQMIRTQLYNIIKESATSTLSDMGDLTNTEDLTKFFQVAVQNAITSAIEMLSECLVEASIYVSVEVTDVASAGCIGFEASLLIDSNFAEDGLKCLIGEMEDLLFNIGNPYGIDPKEVVYNNTYLGIKVYTGIKTPKFLDDADKYPDVQICVNIRANLSSLDRVIGGDTGSWKVIAGVQILDCPYALIPSSLGADKNTHNDIWLIKATFKQSS